MHRALWILYLLIFPTTASAAVSISEVAWMGSVDSANHEWIELENNGSAVNVTDWLLTDSVNFEITLLGTIPADSRVVLERTSDASAEGEAFLIYTGALINSGATLRLLRSDGSLEDQVTGGEDWKNIGGDNVTKETSQYTIDGWVTAQATPGFATDLTTVSQVDDESKSQTSNNNDGKSSDGSSKQTVVLTLPDVTLGLNINAPKIGYVNQDIRFDVEPSGIGKHLINSLKYQWNFGDGSVDSSKTTNHYFQYPGTYVVTVYGGYKRQEQVARHEITVLPVKVSLTTNSSGAVQINNDSPYEIDISGYRLVGERDFVFPLYSILLPQQTVTISTSKIGGTLNTMVSLYDKEEKTLATHLPSLLMGYTPESTDNEITPDYSQLQLAPKVITNSKDDFNFSKKQSPRENIEPSHISSINVSSTELVVAPVIASNSDSRVTYLVLVGVLLLSIVGLYARPKRNENQSNLVV